LGGGSRARLIDLLDLDRRLQHDQRHLGGHAARGRPGRPAGVAGPDQRSDPYPHLQHRRQDLQGSSWTCGRINAQRAVTNTTTPPSTAPTAIANGGFENGTSPWVQSLGGGYLIITGDRPHAGVSSAWLGGYNGANFAIYETIDLPSNGTLTYWWYMGTQESGSTAYDCFRVGLYNSSGTLLATPRTLSNASGAGTCSQDSVNLANYAGQTVRVHFSLANDSTRSPASGWTT
jgi:hypothetical protein